MSTATATIAAPDFRHLRNLTDDLGLFEHAEGTIPRPEHGYCTDDNARLLVASTIASDAAVSDLLSVSLRFVVDSVTASGAVRNRMDITGRWTDTPSTDDCWGRALWGLGFAATNAESAVANPALDAFETAAAQRSRWSRAMAFAAIGAAEVHAVHHGHRGAEQLLGDAIDAIGLCSYDTSPAWVWPEPMLRYGNAVLAEALIAAGNALGRDDALDAGLRMLRWLVELQSSHGHFSVVGTEGRTRAHDPHRPQFDQQPIELAALADACHRAWSLTGDSYWARHVLLARDWFVGRNDVGLTMWDRETGGGFDGLHHDRVNINQGAESTLACVSTFQRSLSVPSRSVDAK